MERHFCSNTALAHWHATGVAVYPALLMKTEILLEQVLGLAIRWVTHFTPRPPNGAGDGGDNDKSFKGKRFCITQLFLTFCSVRSLSRLSVHPYTGGASHSQVKDVFPANCVFIYGE